MQRKGQALINYVWFERMPKLFPQFFKLESNNSVTSTMPHSEAAAIVDQYIFNMPDDEFDNVLARDRRYSGNIEMDF